MNVLNDFLALIDTYIGSSSPWFPYALIGVGIFFTIYLKFPQFRYFKHAINIVRGKYDKPGEKGDTSHFQALTTALSGTVGTGNIAGVAMAIFIGGPAALFWMLITALVGMTTKFVEVTLSHKYRETDADGFIAGGPMYYMKNKLKVPWLAAFFSVMVIVCSFGTGNLPQINSIANSMYAAAGIENWITGAVLAVVLAAVVLGGIKRIASVTERLVPAMALIYFIGALSVIAYNYENILPSLKMIIMHVFTGTAAMGGFLGAGISFAFGKGVGRGLFSNEAGQGSAPIAHASARTKEPVSEGMVSILEPFVDTIIICTLTGLVILSSGVWKEKHTNRFQFTDMEIVAGRYDDKIPQQQQQLADYVREGKGIAVYSGTLTVKDGVLQEPVSIINSRSLAEDVKFYDDAEQLYSGVIQVEDGKIVDDKSITVIGKSLLHSAPLTAEAFTRSFMGSWGRWLIAFGLLLFAFSTTLAWAYYGGRSIVYLFGVKYLIYYRLFYCVVFFFASFVDTTIIWTFSLIATAMMAVPNLLGIFLLRKDMKKTVASYWEGFRKEFPNEKALN